MKEEAEKVKIEEARLSRVFLFGLIGATATTFAVGQLRRTVDWFYVHLTRSQSLRKGGNGGSFRSSFQEEAWRKHYKQYEEEKEACMKQWRKDYKQVQEEHEEYMDAWRKQWRKHYKQYEEEKEACMKQWRKDYKQVQEEHEEYMEAWGKHYKEYEEEMERVTAFRTKAKEYRPDQNQDNTEAAEAKFKEVMTSYEAIKQERNQNL